MRTSPLPHREFDLEKAKSCQKNLVKNQTSNLVRPRRIDNTSREPKASKQAERREEKRKEKGKGKGKGRKRTKVTVLEIRVSDTHCAHNLCREEAIWWWLVVDMKLYKEAGPTGFCLRRSVGREPPLTACCFSASAKPHRAGSGPLMALEPIGFGAGCLSSRAVPSLPDYQMQMIQDSQHEDSQDVQENDPGVLY